MLTKFGVKNFKSIVELEIELGRFNVFIGENGCGKSNVLEAVAMAAAVVANRSTNEDLFHRGMRVARSELVFNAFPPATQPATIEVKFAGRSIGDSTIDAYSLSIEPESNRWVDRRIAENPLLIIDRASTESVAARMAAGAAATSTANTASHDRFWEVMHQYLLFGPIQASGLPSFNIYTANTLALRGLHTLSRHEPLGIFGEGLDVAIAQLPADRRDELIEHAHMIAWFDDIEIDHTGQRKLRGDKPGRSVSDLYFADRFLAEDRRVFSAENANEGILHVLFYLALFLHPNGPKIMGIDNIETALNPHLLRRLVKVLAELAVKHERQALVTTHNPAALDGLNLHDDTQRLFIVSRNDDGHTQVKRVVTKPDRNEGGVKLKLSELWMRGMLGGIPTHF
jgi:predicted ATPase